MRLKLLVGAILALLTVVEPFTDEEPRLFLLNNELANGASLATQPRQQLAAAAKRPHLVGWSDRDSSLAGEAGVLPGDLEDPELVQALYEEKDRPLGESKETKKEKEGESQEAQKEKEASPAPATYQRKVSRLLGTFVIETAHTADPPVTQDRSIEANEPAGARLGEGSGFPGMVVPHQANDTLKANVQNLTSWGVDGEKARIAHDASEVSDEEAARGAAERATQEAEKSATKQSGASGSGKADALDNEVKIAAAKHLLTEQNLPPRVKQLATDYLNQKEKESQKLESGTVRVLSKKLFEAKLANAEMFKLQEMATSQFKTPQLGMKYEFGLSVGSEQGTDRMLSMKVDGVEFAEGGSFIAPEGHVVGVQRCRRYLSKYDDKAKVKEAADHLKKCRTLYDVAHAKARELSQKAMLSREAAKENANPSDKRLGESRKAQELEQDRKIVEADAGFSKAAAAVKAAKQAKKNLTLAKKKFQKAEASELSNKDKLIRNDNVDAREAEVTEREKRIAEREHVYQIAANKLKVAASNLATAAETEAVQTYPEHERKLKLEKRSLRAQKQSMRKREQVLRHKAELLATRMRAFDSAVKHIIENSAKSSSGIADHWTRNAEGKVASEVDSFAAALKQIKSKFSSSNTHEAKAARDGAKIMSAVHDAVEESTQRMHKAHLIQKKALKKEIVENNVHLDAARKSARTIHDASKGKWSAHHGKNKKHVAAIDTKKANASKADASKAPKSADQESTRL